MIGRILEILLGDDRRFSLEHRLFNAVSLLNAVTNVGGVASLLAIENSGLLIALNLGIGFVFAAFYAVSRVRGSYRPLYWPFVLTILVFLVVNSLWNAGSTGGAIWYFIPAIVISTILARSVADACIAAAMFCAGAVSIFVAEHLWPQLVRPYTSPADRLLDASGNLVFAQLFTAGIVLLLASSLNRERRRSDTLLLNVLPEEVADELKRTERVTPRHYGSATVLFTDFVGFTGIAETLTPQQLIDELDRAFREFDRVAAAHNLEKIKTIGDSYMAVAGIPQPSESHAIDAVLAALEIAQWMRTVRLSREAEGKRCWEVRIGVHSGPLVAGVIGQQKFAYDVWGDTVNTASRLESSGVPGRVNISSATYELVRDRVICEPRGLVPAKGKGEIQMYLCVSARD